MPPQQPAPRAGTAAAHRGHPGRRIQPAAGAGQGGPATGRQAAGPLGNEALAPLVATCWLITNQPLAHLAFGLPLMTDLRPFLGPAGGLLTALFAARTPWVLAAAVDNPFLAPALLAELAARAGGTPARRWCAGPPGAWSRFPGSIPSACCPPCKTSSRPTAAPPVFWRCAGPRFCPNRRCSPWTPKAKVFLTSIPPRTCSGPRAWLAGTGSLQDASARVGNTGSAAGG